MQNHLIIRERESAETETQRVIKWCLKVGDLVGRWKKLAKIDGLPQPTLNRKDCNDWVFCCQILVVGGTLEDVQGNTGRHPTPKIQKRRQKINFVKGYYTDKILILWLLLLSTFEGDSVGSYTEPEFWQMSVHSTVAPAPERFSCCWNIVPANLAAQLWHMIHNHQSQITITSDIYDIAAQLWHMVHNRQSQSQVAIANSDHK